MNQPKFVSKPITENHNWCRKIIVSATDKVLLSKDCGGTWRAVYQSKRTNGSVRRTPIAQATALEDIETKVLKYLKGLGISPQLELL